jgi:hypothetical protein
VAVDWNFKRKAKQSKEGDEKDGFLGRGLKCVAKRIHEIEGKERAEGDKAMAERGREGKADCGGGMVVLGGDGGSEECVEVLTRVETEGSGEEFCDERAQIGQFCTGGTWSGGRGQFESGNGGGIATRHSIDLSSHHQSSRKRSRPIEKRLILVEFLTNRAFYPEAIDHFSFNVSGSDCVITSGQPRGRSASTIQKTRGAGHRFLSTGMRIALKRARSQIDSELSE